jgi:heme exporter protein CcmD
MGYIAAGTRWEYVIAAYAATLVIMAALVIVSVLAARRARRDLERLERMPGLRRRAPGDRP